MSRSMCNRRTDFVVDTYEPSEVEQKWLRKQEHEAGIDMLKRRHTAPKRQLYYMNIGCSFSVNHRILDP